MGTNYYMIEDECPSCGRGNKIHIGKSSAGWTFALHVYPEGVGSFNVEINCLADWVELWASPEVRIIDEYGEPVSPEEMERIVTQRTGRAKPAGDKFLRENHAVNGPNNLVRPVLGYGCIAHGEGTYDYHVGDFS